MINRIFITRSHASDMVSLAIRQVERNAMLMSVITHNSYVEIVFMTETREQSKRTVSDIRDYLSADDREKEI